MYCRKCGKQLKEGAKFCNACGAVIETKVAVEESKPAPKKRRKAGALRLIILLIGIIAIVAGALLFLQKDNLGIGQKTNNKETELSSSKADKEEDTVEETDEDEKVTAEETDDETVPEPEPETSAEAMSESANEPASEPETAVTPVSVGEAVALIQAIYTQTNSGNYNREGNLLYRVNSAGGKEPLKMTVSTGNEPLDELMKQYGYSSYSLEYYYDNHDAVAESISDSGYPVFLYAIINGKEYRYYYCRGSLIRRISPEGIVTDNPKTNGFLKGLYLEGYISADVVTSTAQPVVTTLSQAYNSCLNVENNIYANESVYGGHVNAVKEVYRIWDDRLNSVYQEVISRLSANRLEAIRQSERDWMGGRDAAANLARASVSGDNAEVRYYEEMINQTKERVLYLENILQE